MSVTQSVDHTPGGPAAAETSAAELAIRTEH
jgi:hypothetical protein